MRRPRPHRVQRQVVQGIAACAQGAGGKADALGLREYRLRRGFPGSALGRRRIEAVHHRFPSVHVQFGQAGVQAEPSIRQAGWTADAQRATSEVGCATARIPLEQGVYVFTQAGRQPAPAFRAAILGSTPLQL
ncbi:hypothetical protein D3C85_857620 [compost metagenome]